MTPAQITHQLPSKDLIPEPDEVAWFAVHTRSRFEKKVLSQLQDKGIESFLPLFSAKHKWSDRQRMVHEPLFPGYVFVRIAAMQEARVTVLRTIGVTNFVGVRGVGTPIPPAEIQAIQTLLERGVPLQLYQYLNIGQRVRIRGGCLDGIEGILTAINSHESLVVSVQLIQRSVALRIRGYLIEPVRAAGTSTGASKRSLRENALLATKSDGIRELGQGKASLSHP